MPRPHEPDSRLREGVTRSASETLRSGDAARQQPSRSPRPARPRARSRRSLPLVLALKARHRSPRGVRSRPSGSRAARRGTERSRVADACWLVAPAVSLAFSYFRFSLTLRARGVPLICRSGADLTRSCTSSEVNWRLTTEVLAYVPVTTK